MAGALVFDVMGTLFELAPLPAEMQAIWVDRLERRWPFPLPEPKRASTIAEAVQEVVGDR